MICSRLLQISNFGPALTQLIVLEHYANAAPHRFGLGRNIGERAFVAERCPNAVGTICFAGQHDCSGADVVEQIVGSLSVMALPGGQAQPDREALPIDNRMDFGREAPSGATETMNSIPLFSVAACWYARMEVLSIIWMSPSCATAMAFIIRSHTPALRYRTKRLSQVVRGPWRSGRSRHGAPDRSTQKIPFGTRRSSTRGTPLGLLGRSVSITLHSKSVRSYRLMPTLNQHLL